MTQPHNVATPPLGGWTLQGYFDEAVRYLATMSAPCQDRSDGGPMTCTYRDQTGSACVVGHFIPNDHIVAEDYRDYIRSGVGELADRFPELVGVAWPVGGQTLAAELQEVHDTPSAWLDGFGYPQLLRTVASTYDLDPSVIDTQTWAEVDQ